MILLMLACDAGIPDRVLMSGIVYDDRHDNAEPLSEATVSTLGPEYGEVVGSAVTDGRGWFEVEVIAGAPVYVTVESESSVPTGFSGMADIADFELEDGTAWARDEGDLGEIEAEFEGCPGLGQPGGVIEGEVRVHMPGYEVEGGEWPVAPTAHVVAYDSSGAPSRWRSKGSESMTSTPSWFRRCPRCSV